MRIIPSLILAATMVAASAHLNARQEAPAKPKGPTVEFVTKPAPPAVGPTEFLVTLTGADGKPITNAAVSVTLVMPAMPAMNMPEMKNTVTLKPVTGTPADAGTYAARGQVMMAGRWNVIVTAKDKDKKTIVEQKLTLTAK